MHVESNHEESCASSCSTRHGAHTTAQRGSHPPSDAALVRGWRKCSRVLRPRFDAPTRDENFLVSSCTLCKIKPRQFFVCTAHVCVIARMLPSVFIFTPSEAHPVLLQNGCFHANIPPGNPAAPLFTSPRSVHARCPPSRANRQQQHASASHGILDTIHECR